MDDVKLTGHHYPRPPTVCIVKEIKRCPLCGADREHGFEVLIDETLEDISEDKYATKTLEIGVACLCWCCGFRF